MASTFDYDTFEEVESESVTSGSEYLPSEDDKSDNESSVSSVSLLQMPNKLKPQAGKKVPLDSDYDSTESTDGAIKQKSKNLKFRCSTKSLDNLEEVYSEPITSGSKSVLPEGAISDSDSSILSLSHLQLPKKVKPQVENVVPLESDSTISTDGAKNWNFKSTFNTKTSKKPLKQKKKNGTEVPKKPVSIESTDHSDSEISVELNRGLSNLSKKSKNLKYKSLNKSKDVVSTLSSKKTLTQKKKIGTEVPEEPMSLESSDDSDSEISVQLNGGLSDLSEKSKESESKIELENYSDMDWSEHESEHTSKTKKPEPKKNTKSQELPNNTNNSLSEQSSFDISIDMNLESVGPVIKNKFNEVVLDSSHGCKKNCCLYCLRDKIKYNNPNKKVLYTKLVEHYEKAHKKELLIDKLLKIKKEKRVPGEPLTKNAEKRLKILKFLQLKANHLNNLQAKDVKDFVVTRRPNAGKTNTVAMYLCCFKCHKRLSVKSMHKHVKKCTGIESFSKHRVIKSLARAVEGDYHEIASEGAIKIISVMHETMAVNEIRYDKALFIWLNAEASAYEADNQKHNHKRVRANISRLGTLLHEMKKLDNNITQISDIFHEDHYENVIKAVKIMGKPHPITKYMQSPATANDMFNLIKAASGVYDVTMGSKNETKRLEIQAFERKLNLLWHKSIGNTIAQTQANRRKNTIIELPDQADRQLLREHLENEITFHFSSLQNIYSDDSYEKLRNALLTYLQFTNCRRPGEVERMEMVDYKNKVICDDECRMEVRGKRSRPVPVVFKKKLLPCLEWLVLCRPQAKIHSDNPYFFANIQDVSVHEFTCASGVKLMEQFSKQCGAAKPHTLKSTLHRMHLATDQMEKGIDEHGVEQLSGFMGHTPKIHRQNYRKSVVRRDVMIAKKVRQSQGIDDDNFFLNAVDEEENFDEANFEPFEEMDTTKPVCTESSPNHNTLFDTRIENKNDDSMSAKAKKSYLTTRGQTAKEIVTRKPLNARPQSRPHANPNGSSYPATTGKHKSWTEAAEKELFDHFPQALDLQYKVPSSAEILNFIANAGDPITRQRTEPQIRSHIHTKRNLLKNGDAVAERSHIPTWIYSSFEKYIAAKKLPSHSTCARFLGKSPSKSKITIASIQDWVKKAIQKKSK